MGRKKRNSITEEINPELLKLYQELNKEFFDNSLPIPDGLYYRELISNGGFFTKFKFIKRIEISISKKIRIQHGIKEVKNTLLHEMVHYWEYLETGNTSNESKLFRWKLKQVSGKYYAPSILTKKEFSVLQAKKEFENLANLLQED